MKKTKTIPAPLAALRHHVSGAIARGEAQAIAGIPAIATETPQIATIPAGEGKDTGPMVISRPSLEREAREFAPPRKSATGRAASDLVATLRTERDKARKELAEACAELATLKREAREVSDLLFDALPYVEEGEQFNKPTAPKLSKRIRAKL